MRPLLALVLAGCAAAPDGGALDLRVETDVQARRPVEVYVRVRARDAVHVRVELVPEGGGEAKELASRTVASGGEQSFLFTFPAPARGNYAVRACSGGVTCEAPLRVKERRLRILYVEHPPRYEYRFLKGSLLRDPDLLAHCLLTSADSDFPQEHTPQGEGPFGQPLKAFPADADALARYDVLLFGDVNPARLGPETAGHIDAFVRKHGGGIVFLSGMSHNPRSFRGTPLAELLPVAAEAGPDGMEGLPYRVTAEGRAFLKVGAAETLRALEEQADFPQFRWLALGRPKEGATVLVRAGDWPLFVTAKAGSGRVFWIAGDETWLWRKLWGDSPYFYPFWKRVFQWAAGGA